MTPADIQLIFFTVGCAALAIAILLPFAIAMAWLLARKDWLGKSLIETFFMLPIVMPPVVTGLILLHLFGRNGPVGGFLENQLGIEIVFTWKAVVIAMGVMSFPLVLGCIRTAFEETPPHLECAARTLGGKPWRVFLKITLPLARRGIIAGVILGFSRAIGEFGATVMVAGFIPGLTETLPLAIYRSVQSGDDNRAWLLAAVSVIISVISVLITRSFLNRRPRRMLSPDFPSGQNKDAS